MTIIKYNQLIKFSRYKIRIANQTVPLEDIHIDAFVDACVNTLFIAIGEKIIDLYKLILIMIVINKQHITNLYEHNLWKIAHLMQMLV